MITSKRFWSGVVVGLAMGGLEDVYNRLTVPHPFLASLGTFAAAYGLLWGAAAVDEWRGGRRARTKIIGGRIGGSPSDHGPSTRESPRSCDSRGSRE